MKIRPQAKAETNTSAIEAETNTLAVEAEFEVET